jgi:hypothetical protein
MTEIVSLSQRREVDRAPLKVQICIKTKVQKLITKELTPRSPKRRHWKCWPAMNRVDDAIRLVEAMRDTVLLHQDADRGVCKILSSECILRLQDPLPENKVDKLWTLLAQSVFDRAVDVNPGLKVHGKNDFLVGDRGSKGHGLCFAQTDRASYESTLDALENMLRAKRIDVHTTTSPSSSSESALLE